MALNKKPTFANRPLLAVIQITNTDGINLKDIVVAGASGNKVIAVFATGEVTANRDVQLAVLRASAINPVATSSVPLNAGRAAAVPPKDLIPTALREALPKDADQQAFLFLSSGDTLQARVTTAVTAAETLSVFVIHAAFDDEA